MTADDQLRAYQAQIQALEMKKLTASPEQYQEIAAQISAIQQNIAKITSFRQSKLF